jgi:hypothetical protein
MPSLIHIHTIPHHATPLPHPTDPGYKKDRQYGRGQSGGQVRDEYREDYDEGRGGYGALLRLQEQDRERLQQDVYSTSNIPEGSRDNYSPSSKSKQVLDRLGKRAREEESDGDGVEAKRARD